MRGKLHHYLRDKLYWGLDSNLWSQKRAFWASGMSKHLFDQYSPLVQRLMNKYDKKKITIAQRWFFWRKQ